MDKMHKIINTEEFVKKETERVRNEKLSNEQKMKR